MENTFIDIDNYLDIKDEISSNSSSGSSTGKKKKKKEPKPINLFIEDSDG